LAQEHARDAMRVDGALDPALFVASPEGLFLLSPMTWERPREKQDFFANLRLVCIAHAATALVLAYQAREVVAEPGELLPPLRGSSEALPGEEFIVLSGEGDGGLHQQRLALILRDGQGRVSGLGPFVAAAAEESECAMTNLLPEVPPTREMRAVANSILKTRGLGFVEATPEARANDESRTRHPPYQGGPR
jgi:hypothetical protein